MNSIKTKFPGQIDRLQRMRMECQVRDIRGAVMTSDEVRTVPAVTH